MVEWKVEIPGNTISREWYNYIWVEEPKLDKNAWMKGKTINQIAQAQNKGIIDGFLDLVVEEKLETTFMQAENNVDVDAMKAILNFPNALIGLSDGGAHVQFHGGYGFSTRLLGEWVREKRRDEPRTGGAPADLRTRPRPSASMTAGCCGPA